MKNKFTVLLIVLCIIANTIYIFVDFNKTVPIFSDNISQIDVTAYNKLYTNDDLILVNIVGEVNYPDMYILKSGSTIKDAIDICGGLKPTADKNSINIDKVLSDKELLIIPKLITPEATNGNLININTADKDTLKSLPGIGDVISYDIIYYRENISPFYTISDIQNVNNIGPKTYKNIEHLITTH